MTSRSGSLLLLVVLAGCNRTPSADMVVFGRVWTGDPQQPWVGAVAIRGDTVLAVGDSAALVHYVGKETRRLDNGSAMVVPGFMDGHTHFLSGGYQLSSVDLRPATSPAEFVATLKSFAAERKPGEWILGETGIMSDGRVRRFPRKTGSIRSHPTTPSSSTVSTATWDWPIRRRFGRPALPGPLRDIEGGTIVRDPRTREPTGILKDGAMVPIYLVVPAPTAEQDDAALNRAMEFVAAKGVTAAAMVSSPWSELSALERARKGGHLTIRATIFHPLEEWRAVAERSRLGVGSGMTGFGSPGLRATWMAPSVRPRPCFTSPTTMSRIPAGY